ncbi:MAG: DUF4167 domain-containing protein [Pseudomonadota bacterium]
MKRQRGRGRRSGGGNNNNPNRHFESNGPDVKIRGSAQQILDKYQQYARDAQSSGDRVSAENYLQHAEHYSRVLAGMQPKDKPRDDQRQQGAAEEGAAADAAADGPAADTNTASTETAAEDGGDGRQTRGRGRRRKRDDQSTAEVNAETSADTEAAEETSDAKAEEAPADPPKPRTRRPRKKPVDAEPAAEAVDQDDGVMKTLSRGRAAAESEAKEDVVAPADDSVSETAID